MHMIHEYRDTLPQVLVELSDQWIPDSLPSVMMSISLFVGAIGLYCSAMIYVATRRVLWRRSRTFAAFGSSTLIGGLALFVPVLLWFDASTNAIAFTTAALSVFGAVKLAWEYRLRAATSTIGDAYDSRSRRLLSGPLKQWSAWRLRLALAGLALATISIVIAGGQFPKLAFLVSCCAAMLLIAGELMERLLYFSSVVYDRMPGTLR
jgi:DMSO reductase anchor subunit